MPAKGLSEDKIRRLRECRDRAVADWDRGERNGKMSVRALAISYIMSDLKISRNAAEHRYLTYITDQETAEAAGAPEQLVTFPSLPESDAPAEELIEQLCKRFEKKQAHERARAWRRVRINTPGPFAVAFIGDPHVDNAGCNWPLLKRDVNIIRETPHLWAANAGDTVDNWTGRLMRLKGKTPVTDSEAWRLAQWLIDQLADKWLMFVLGNHDTWGEGSEIFRQLCKNVIMCDDWEAKVTLESANGEEFPVWLAHSFKGSSIWNPAHGPMRQAKLSGRACLYVQGHHHEWAVHTEEDANRDHVFHAIKARGYKFIDDYAVTNGFAQQQEGATITAIFDPDSKTLSGRCVVIPDLQEAAEFLTWKRERFDRCG